MSHHNAAMLLAPAKPKPIKEFHLLGLHHHFTGGQAAGVTLVLLVALAVLLMLAASAVSDARTRRENLRKYPRPQ